MKRYRVHFGVARVRDVSVACVGHLHDLIILNLRKEKMASHSCSFRTRNRTREPISLVEFQVFGSSGFRHIAKTR